MNTRKINNKVLKYRPKTHNKNKNKKITKRWKWNIAYVSFQQIRNFRPKSKRKKRL